MPNSIKMSTVIWAAIVQRNKKDYNENTDRVYNSTVCTHSDAQYHFSKSEKGDEIVIYPESTLFYSSLLIYLRTNRCPTD